MKEAGRPRELTGRHVLIIALAAFGVILAANLTMLFAATGTFPGLVVKNSYVASQQWNDRTSRQRALGWQAEALLEGGRLSVAVTDSGGAPVRGLELAATVGRPATMAEDRKLALAEAGGAYAAPLELRPGRWRIEIAGSDAAGNVYTAEAELYVKAAD